MKVPSMHDKKKIFSRQKIYYFFRAISKVALLILCRMFILGAKKQYFEKQDFENLFK